MRVLYVVHDHYWEDANLLAGLRQAGHEVRVVRPGHPFHEVLGPDWTDEDRDRSSERLVEQVRAELAREPADVVFCYLLDGLVRPEAIREIGAMGPTTLNYWCNGGHQFRLVEEISPAFDLCVVTERDSLGHYEAVGANPFYLQLAANPELYGPVPGPPVHDVTFVGQRYADRPEYVDYLLRHGVDVRVWGPGWTRDRTYGEQGIGLGVNPRLLLRHPRAGALRLVYEARQGWRRLEAVPPPARRRLARAAGPSLPFEELVAMYSRSSISLGFSTTGDARYADTDKIRQIHLRDFEAPMSGACYFVEHQDELADFYELEREIVTYASREELLEKVRHYLARPDEVERIRARGHERARRDHTWERRFGELFSSL